MRIIQKPGKQHTFPCGCTGILPKKRGIPNKFAWWGSRTMRSTWFCRVSIILSASQFNTKKGIKPVNKNTPHSIVREMMKNPKCICCRKTLKWVFKRGKTPHFHHNHKTGKPLGFSHLACNWHALEREIYRLRQENTQLKRRLHV
jgi:hypothetical protein